MMKSILRILVGMGLALGGFGLTFAFLIVGPAWSAPKKALGVPTQVVLFLRKIDLVERHSSTSSLVKVRAVEVEQVSASGSGVAQDNYRYKTFFLPSYCENLVLAVRAAPKKEKLLVRGKMMTPSSLEDSGEVVFDYTDPAFNCAL